jgi:hypothetical protein
MWGFLKKRVLNFERHDMFGFFNSSVLLNKALGDDENVISGFDMFSSVSSFSSSSSFSFFFFYFFLFLLLFFFVLFFFGTFS